MVRVGADMAAPARARTTAVFMSNIELVDLDVAKRKVSERPAPQCIV
jgi:hypothetical protein